MKTSEYHAPDIECAGCADSIKRSLGKLAGVATVEVEIGPKLVRVAYDEALVSSDQVKSRLEASGFRASKRGLESACRNQRGRWEMCAG